MVSYRVIIAGAMALGDTDDALTVGAPRAGSFFPQFFAWLLHPEFCQFQVSLHPIGMMTRAARIASTEVSSHHELRLGGGPLFNVERNASSVRYEPIVGMHHVATTPVPYTVHWYSSSSRATNLLTSCGGGGTSNSTSGP
jgi:hypothetical protein